MIGPVMAIRPSVNVTHNGIWFVMSGTVSALLAILNLLKHARLCLAFLFFSLSVGPLRHLVGPGVARSRRVKGGALCAAAGRILGAATLMRCDSPCGGMARCRLATHLRQRHASPGYLGGLPVRRGRSILKRDFGSILAPPRLAVARGPHAPRSAAGERSMRRAAPHVSPRTSGVSLITSTFADGLVAAD